ncbi:MAG: aldo/keto reductase [Clostridia bacterium]|nr:aldo/keto reductase [Clostridia bacterium]
MIFKDFKGKKLSALGMGCMRFPTQENGEIDEAQTAEMFDYAIQNGVNYFDTAWGYHNGQSEIVTGKLLKKYPRDSYYLADKFPGYDLSNMGKVEEIFEKQLEKTGAEYFDFYLFHNVCERNIEEYLDEKNGIFDYLMQQKANGRIRHLGFSAHADLPTLKRFLEKYGHAMEFGQLQLNWIDWTFQKGAEKVQLLQEYGIPVWVMEPVRGGKLAQLAPKYEAVLKALRPDESIAAWAFRFLQSKEGLVVTLSGMSNFAQLKENVETYAAEKPLNEAEGKALENILSEMLEGITPCTACRYCTEYCPQGLNIPELLELYNEHKFSGGGFIAPMRISALAEDKRPSACIACRACEGVCPQRIAISEVLADFSERLK